jgi:WD40 repeat protein
MGEVFRAFDLKLRVDVALKAVRAGRLGSERARDLLRREVRSAREVVSPNVCRIFDLAVEDGQEFVSMEYIDGATLADTMREKGPLALPEAREIASQFLSGLEAIHRAGLVHRDFKPENVMITRAGRVVVMDFGLAKGAAEGRAWTIAGTPGYMAPEQSRGEGVDARADVFAAGVVLSEMLAVGAGGILEARQALWDAIRETPPRVPEGPWAPALRQAVAANPRERHASAHALARALEEATERLPGFETKRPYPGLASFTWEDAEYFFGREVETEAVWKKLKRPRLLAVIGPSGAGKSSFLQAGLLPSLPTSWRAVLTTPGARPFQALAQALAPAFAGDTEAVQSLLRFEEEDSAVSLLQRFRQRQERVLLVVDQFEELFTLNPPEIEEAFARLIGRLVLEADLHVIISLRDDFLLRCHAHEALLPAFSDLTPLGPLGESALRRALVQPALACGYHFEDESLVEEMVGEVVKERGALPLLAFAASRLWELRDRERGLLTRKAYQEIGGVAGALAQHAEATLERIGTPRLPLVRELFRNLVTAQGTRAVRERSDLLSVFERAGGPKARPEAEAVLSALVDARLLTSYERAGEGGESHQQVEIIHESLLSAWPRLVRWQTQDADGAQVRDQLRQVAQVWQDRGRPEDLLWAGTAYRDFAVWRERYPGGLSATEEAFAEAARRRDGRTRRRRQAAMSALLAGVGLVAVISSVLWRRSEVSLRKAEAETLRAEAGKLLVMGERELQRYPTGALAYAMKSLELADTEAGRLLAVRVLHRAPVARLALLTKVNSETIDFSPNAEWVALGSRGQAELLHWDGGKRPMLGDYGARGGPIPLVRFGTASDVLIANRMGDIRVWSVPDGRELRRAQVDEGPSSLGLGKDAFLTLTTVGSRAILRSWPLVSGEPRLVGSMEAPGLSDTTGRAVAYSEGRAVYFRRFDDWGAPPRLVVQQPTDIGQLALSPDATRVATSDETDRIRLWPTATRSTRPERVLRSPEAVVGLGYDPTGRWLSAQGFERGYPTFSLFDLAGPPGAEPMVLEKGDTDSAGNLAFDGSGRWLATTHGREVAFWPLDAPRARVFREGGGGSSVLFAPDGSALLSLGAGGMRAWPLRGIGETRMLVAAAPQTPPSFFMAVDPTGRRLAVAGAEGRLSVVPLDGGPAQSLRGFRSLVGRPAFGEDGRLVAAGALAGPGKEKVVRVWDLETGAVRTFGPLPGAGDRLAGGIRDVRFVGKDRLLASSWGTGIVSLDLSSGASRVVVAHPIFDFVVSRDGRFGVATTRVEDLTKEPRPLVVFNLADGTARSLPLHGTAVTAVALDPSDSILATGSSDGTIRIGRISGEEPHVLLGQEGAVHSVAFSPDGRWLASSGEEFAIHLWPVPDVSRPLLHRRPHDELLTVLRSHTNLRAVADPGSATGYRLEPGPFPGWAKVPEW